MTLTGLSTQHLNGLVCEVTAAAENGRVAVVPVEAPASLPQGSLLQGFKVKPINCNPLPPKQSHQRRQQQQALHQQRHLEDLGDMSPIHTVIKAIEVALFACAIRVRIRIFRTPLLAT